MNKVLRALALVAVMIAPASAQNVDTVSSYLQLLLMGNGLHPSDWGTQSNTNLLKVERAIAGVSTITASGNPITLTADQARSSALVFTGTLAANEVVTVPSVSKLWIVRNNTSGAFTLSLKTAAGAAVTVPQVAGVPNVYWCDGTNIFNASSDGLPALTVNTALANIGAGTAAVPLADLATAMSLGVASTPIFAGLDVRGVAGALRTLYFRTGATSRWTVGADGTAEAGSNAGSDFAITGYADDGTTVLGKWFFIKRSTGAIGMAGSLAVAGSISAGGVVLNPLAEGLLRNVSIRVTSNTTVDVKADSLTMADAAGNVKAFRNLSNVGAQGMSTACAYAIRCLDVGTVGVSRFLNVWAIGTAAGVVDTIFTGNADPSQPTLPTGYTYAVRLGAVRVDNTGNLYRTLQVQNRAQYVVTAGTNTASPPIFASGNAGTPNQNAFATVYVSYTVRGLSSIVPPTATAVIVIAAAPGNGTTLSVAPSANYGAAPSPAPLQLGGFANATGSLAAYSATAQIALENNTLAYAGNGGASASILGWIENF